MPQIYSTFWLSLCFSLNQNSSQLLLLIMWVCKPQTSPWSQGCLQALRNRMSSKTSGLSLDMPGYLYCSVPSRDLGDSITISIPNLAFKLTAFWNSVLGVLPPPVLRLLPCNQSAMLYLSHAVRAVHYTCMRTHKPHNSTFCVSHLPRLKLWEIAIASCLSREISFSLYFWCSDAAIWYSLRNTS